MVARVAYIHPHLAVAAALIAVFAAWGAERLGADSHGSPDADGGRINVLHPNPQSIFDGLQIGFVNVSTGNLTFERRDIVVPGRRRVVFSRIHDSRIRGNADFGPGWRLSLDEEIVVDGDAASYVDRSGARYGFRREPDGRFVPDPMVPRLSGMRLAVAGETATLDAGDGGVRLFERPVPARHRWVLRRIEWRGGDWIEISRSDGRVATVFDGEGEMLRVERDAEGRIATVADRHRREVRYEYDGLGRLAQVRDLGGNLWSHRYDAANRLSGALGVDGAPYLRPGYDAAGRVAWSVGEAAFAFEYGPDRTVVSDRTTGGRHVFERTVGGLVEGFSSTTGIAWRLRMDDSGRLETLGMSETAARLADDGPEAFRPDGAVPEDGELRGWARTVHFGHSADGVAATETVSAAGRERRDYEYDVEGRLTAARSSTGGIPTLDVDYADVTALRTGWAGSDMAFEFHAGPDGAAMVGNGRTRIEIERDRRGAVVALRGGAGSVLFERDRLGRIEAARHVDGSAARYFRDALGYRTLAEYGGGMWRRVAVDASGDVVGFVTADERGGLATAGTGVRVVELNEDWIAHFGQLGVLTGDRPKAAQPDYGVFSFGGDFAPRPRSPLRVGVPGLHQALALAPVAAVTRPTLNTVRWSEEMPVPRHTVFRSIAVFAMLVASGPCGPATSQDSAEPPADCPRAGSDVVVKALRFSDGPPSFSFMVTNNGTRPIHNLSLGAGGDIVGDMYIKAGYETVPRSVGSPVGWQGMHVFAQDPRLPQAHSHSLVTYLWIAEDPMVFIQPGQSLTGFSVQLPPTKMNSSGKPRHPEHPDLTSVPFVVDLYGARCPVVGTVELDPTAREPLAS